MSNKPKAVVDVSEGGNPPAAPVEESPRFNFVRNIGFDDPVDLGGKIGTVRFSRRKDQTFSTFVTESKEVAEAVRAFAKKNPGCLIFEK